MMLKDKQSHYTCAAMYERFPVAPCAVKSEIRQSTRYCNISAYIDPIRINIIIRLFSFKYNSCGIIYKITIIRPYLQSIIKKGR